jgi:hypothetical protein
MSAPLRPCPYCIKLSALVDKLLDDVPCKEKPNWQNDEFIEGYNAQCAEVFAYIKKERGGDDNKG